MTQISSVGANPLIVANGGTGAATLTSGGVLIGAGTGAVTATVTPSGLTSVTSGSFITSSATVGITLSDTGLIPTGTDVNISLSLAGKGSGGVVHARGIVGGDVTIESTNSDNTNGASRAGLEVAVGGTSAGDPYVNFLINGSTTYTMGIDNSASDAFVLSNSAALGTTDLLSMSTSGDMTLSKGALIPNGTSITFSASPVLQATATTGAAPTGATGAVNLMMLQGGEIMEQFIIGGGQTIIAPRMSTTGLLTSLDLTATEGAEYNFGINANSKHAYTIGTSAAFYIELAVNAADVGGLDPLLVGFRKNDANNGTYTSYTDFASIGARATTATDVAVISTDLNNAGEVYTNTTDAWTDGQTKTFKVLVSAAGVVTYTINGAAPTATAAFTFDAGDVVIPFIHHVFGATNPGAINWVSLKIGFQ